MKKLLAIISAFVLTMSLIACGGGTTSPAKKKVVIKYCGWDLGTEEENNLVRRLIANYNKNSTEVRIQMVSSEGNPTEWLSTLASANNLPDVFLVENVAQAIKDDWALDLTSYVSQDPEWQDVEEGLRESVTYGEKVYAIPAAQDYIGYKINYDLVNNYATIDDEAENIFYAGSDLYTTDKLFEVVKSMRNINVNDGTGYIGLDMTGDIINWLPASLDETGTIKHFVWDGTNFQFTSDAMYDAILKIREIANTTEQYVLSSIPDTTGEGDDLVEHKKQIFGSVDRMDVFANGKLGFVQDGSWTSDTTHDFNYKFIGFPNNKVISTADYMCVNAYSKNKDYAYEVAKYLTFGLQGCLDRFNIIDNNKEAGLSLDGLPISTNSQVVDKWFDYVALNGLEEVFKCVAEGKIDVLVEGNKVVPGFIEARFKYETGVIVPGNRGDSALSIGDLIWDVCSCQISEIDWKTNMTTTLEGNINKVIDDAYKALGIERE